ncbi:MAG: hypothetical protein ACP5U1_14890, partial [Desulfomonilaceae bacterium]
NRMHSWYDLAFRRRDRTTFGVSGMSPEAVADFIGGFLDGSNSENPRNDLPLALVLKLAVDDLKSYYFEAAEGQSGDSTPDSGQLSDWFWNKTVAARVLRKVKEFCESSNDQMLQVTGARLIIPLDQSL